MDLEKARINESWVLLSALLISYTWLAWRIFAFPGHNLNVDTYYYIAQGSSWALCNTIKFQDAFTVGSVIPSVLGILSIIFKLLHIKNIVFWLIISTKIISLLCYGAVLVSCIYVKPKGGNPLYVRIALVSIALLTFNLFGSITSSAEMARDGISLNGEIVCVAIISLQLLLLDVSRHSKYKYIYHALIFILVLNTKIQAAPISLLIIIFASEKGNRLYFIFWLLGLFVCSEIILYIKEVGLLFNFFDILKYIQHVSIEQSFFDVIIIRVLNCVQTTFNAIKINPLILICILISISTQFFKNKNLKNSSKFLILLIVVFICVNIPNRSFVHYSILYWIPFVYFVRNYRYKKSKIFVWLLAIIIPLCCVFTLVFWNANHFSRASSFHEAFSPYNKNEMLELKDFLKRNHLKRVYINAWDYVLYSFLEACPAEEEYPDLVLGLIDKKTYYKKIFSGKYDAIIQYPGNGQIETEARFILDGNEIKNYADPLTFREINLADEVSVFYRCNR